MKMLLLALSMVAACTFAQQDGDVITCGDGAARCPGALTCFDTPNDGCDPDKGHLGCAGICVETLPCPCPAIFDPVCGANNETYGNACEAICDGEESFVGGPCPPPIGTAGAAAAFPGVPFD